MFDDDKLKKLVEDQVKNNIEAESLGRNGPMSRILIEMGLWSQDVRFRTLKCHWS
jgi:hypothetical protein